MKTEYQGRGTPHWHICAWVVSFGLLQHLAGRTGTAVVSVFVKFLSLLFCAEIDGQIGNGRLNYINGYVSKDHDAVDVGLGEYVQKNANSSWLTAYRLLSKSSPCLPEVAIRMKKCPSTLAPVSRTAVGRPGRGEERREKTGMHGGGREG